MREDSLVTASEVARRLGVARWSVYDLARRGILPHVKLGRVVKFDPSALEDFIRQGGCGLEAKGRES